MGQLLDDRGHFASDAVVTLHQSQFYISDAAPDRPGDAIERIAAGIAG